MTAHMFVRDVCDIAGDKAWLSFTTYLHYTKALYNTTIIVVHVVQCGISILQNYYTEPCAPHTGYAGGSTLVLCVT